MAKQLNSEKSSEGSTAKLTLSLDENLRDALEAERQRVAALTGYRPSRAAVGELLLKRALQNTAATAA